MAMTTPRYSTILFDLDDTLLDSVTSARLAFDDTMASIDIADADAYRPLFADINVDLWGRVETGELTPSQVKTLRFVQLVEKGGLDADPHALTSVYGAGLARFGDLYPGAYEMLDELKAMSTLAIVTNGVSEIQRNRLAHHELVDYFTEIVISDEVGFSKPGPEILDLALERLGDPDKDAVLMIGDSLSSDMPGAAAYGIDSIWFNPTGKDNGSVPVTYTVTGLAEIPPIVRG